MRVVVTGGAGFIGSHIAASYADDGHDVVVLDDLSTGFADNVVDADLVTGDVADLDTVRKVVDGADLVFHEAASRAVLRSVEDPIATDTTNTRGTLHVLVAARDAGVARVVLASSSSVYGGEAPLPTSEDAPLRPKSPYAVSKLAGEHYASVFWHLYGLETVCLRYFNVFGPRQRPDSAYAAVIPLFIEALTSGDRPEVHGDGRQSRDFTYVDDVVAANHLAAEADAEVVCGNVYNIARDDEYSILDLLEALGEVLDVEPDPVFTDPRQGDIRHSRADISRARTDLGYEPSVSFREGLARMVAWYQQWQGRHLTGS